MTKWRPDSWGNPYKTLTTSDTLLKEDVYEKGADAMWDAFQERFQGVIYIDDSTPKGSWVFIPVDEKQNFKSLKKRIAIQTKEQDEN